MRKKITRIFLWVVAIVLLLAGTSFVLLQLNSVQTWLAQRAAAYLSDQLKTKVTVGKVSIRFVKKVSLKNLYIEDLHHDTLLYADELLININNFSTSRHALELDKITLDHAKFFLTRYHGEKFDNIQFLSDYFASKDTTKSSLKWKIKLNDIRLENIVFRHVVEDHAVKMQGVDFAHLDVENIFGDLKAISFVNDSIFTTISGLRFTDKSGFRLDELSANAKISSHEIRLKNLVIRTPQTDLHSDLAFQFDRLSAFDDFETKVNFNSDFKKSAVSFKDISFFVTDLYGVNESVKLDGNFKGTVNKFKGRNVAIEFGEHSFFKGNVAMSGLPDINATYMDILATDVVATKKDVEKIPLPPFGQHEHVVIPENLSALGKINFKGKFTGFVSDFVAFGNVNTEIGFFSSDLNVKMDSVTHVSVYKGHLSTNHFNIGKIFSVPELGAVTMNADINGTGMKLENADAKLFGTIESLEFRNYSYTGIKINGEVSKKLFSGALTIHEPNADMDFSGTVNFKQTMPEFNFTADIGHAHLDTLNLFNYRGEEELKTKIVSHFTGNKFDNLEGSIELQNTDFRFDKVLYHINHVQLNAVNTNGMRSFVVQSDNVDADFTGRFELATLGDAFKQIIPRYLPAVILPVKSVASNQDFSFNITLKNMSVITENFLPSWWVEPDTRISGKFNSIQNNVSLNIESPLIRYKNFSFINTHFHNSADVEKMDMQFSSDTLYYSGSSYVSHPRILTEAINNKVSFELGLSDSLIYSDRANLKGEIVFASAKKFDLHFGESSILLQNKKWELSTGNKISFDSSSIAFTNFSIAKQQEKIGIAGILSENESDQLSADFTNFNLQNLDPLLKSSSFKLGGLLSGKATVSDVFRKIKFVSNLDVDKLQFNGDTLGNASFITTFDDDNKNISVDAFIQNGSVKTVAVKGDYHINMDKNNLDFTVKLNNLYLNSFGKYIDDVVSELNGRVSGDLTLTGNFNQPVFKGKINLNRVRCKVNYLNTRYSFTNEITVGENYFELKDFQLVDEKNESALANGRIEHTYFKNFTFHVNLDATKFQCLNTVASQNSIYYGTAYASGSAYFSGPLESMTMQIQFTSEKGTKIFIPLTTSSEISQSNFISFREKGKFNNFGSLTNRMNLSGIKLDMTLDMTPDAEIQIIFDEKIGDKITGNGYGNLRLDINSIGDFSMYGNYEIEKGTYLFTLQNIINKNFTIQKGSTISWSGNPYDADINLSAMYTVTTSSLYKLLPDSSYRTSLKVDCELNLSNKLMNPTIKYSINVRGVDASAQSQIHSLLNSEAEVSKQMFGLLVLNQFIPSATSPTSNRIDAGVSAGANGIEFLSDQVNNWLSQISNNVNIGVDYKVADIYSRDEIKLMFSKSLANDRILIEGDVGKVGAAAATADQSSGSIVSDITGYYYISDNRRFRIKAYNKSNISSIVYNNAPYTQGLGIFYREEFNTIRELMERYKLLKKKDVVKGTSSLNK